MPHTLINQAPILLAKAMLECPTSFTSIYKNIYNPKSKIRLLLISSIAGMLVESQGENKRKQEVKPIED